MTATNHMRISNIIKNLQRHSKEYFKYSLPMLVKMIRANIRPSIAIGILELDNSFQPSHFVRDTLTF